MSYLPEELHRITVDCFSALELEDLDEAWVDEVNYNDFTCETLYPSILASNLIDSLQKAINVGKLWFERSRQMNKECPSTSCNETLDDTSNDCSNDANNDCSNITTNEELFIWKVFVDNNIEIRSLLALIFLLCSRGKKPSALIEEKILGLTAAKLYFTLLQIPGSNAYYIFNQELIKVAVSNLKISEEQLGNKTRMPMPSNHSNGSKKRKRIGRENSEAPTETSETTENDLTPENEDLEILWDEEEMQKMLSGFSEVLLELVDFLSVFSLKKYPDILDYFMTVLMDFTAIETQRSDFQFDKSAQELFNTRKRFGLIYCVNALAYKAVLALYQPIHGKSDTNYVFILKHLCNSILCARTRGQTNQTIPHKSVVVKDNAVAFVCYNLRKFPHYSVSCSRTLIQQLSIRVTDKADYRVKVAQAIVAMLREFPLTEYASMIEWFVRFVNLSKVQDRIMGLEILSLLLFEPERNVGNLSDELSSYVTLIPIVISIIERCADKAATVRSKALAILSFNLQKILFVLNGKKWNQSKRADSESDDSSSASSYLDSDLEEQPAQTLEPALPEKHIDKIAAILRNRIKDLKVHVRKAALQGIESLICLNKKYLDEESMCLFADAAIDPNITVKRVCLASVTSILQKYRNSDKARSCWLQCVLPLIHDPEKTIQTKSLEVMEMQLLHNISGSDSERKCAWALMNSIACGDHYNLQRFLSKAFTLWKVEGKLRSNLRSILEQEVGSENDAAAWLMLSLLTMNIEIKSTIFIVNYWESCFKVLNDYAVKQLVLKVIGNTCKHLNHDKLQSIQRKLEREIKNFHCPVELISVSIETLFKLFEVQCSKQDNYQRIMTNFATEVMKVCVTFLSPLVLERFPNIELHPEALICQHLFTLGVLCLLCPPAIPDKSYLIVQTMAASFHMDDDRCSIHSGRSARNSLKSLHEKGFSPKVRAVAFITLGKLCLQDENLAKQCIPALARELANTKYYIIKNNIIIVLSDLCVRYTSAVDLYIPTISTCLKDRNSLVRHQTLTLLSRLLQEDYIKSKDSLFYRMLSMLIDDDPKIRSLTDFCFSHMMAKRNPAIFSQHFNDCIFFFNGHRGISKNNHLNIYDQDIKLFSLKGDRNRSKRMAIYKFMLKNSPSQKRFVIFTSIYADMFSSFTASVIPLDDDGHAIIKDCLQILSCDEIKLTSSQASNDDDDDESEVSINSATKEFQCAHLEHVIVPHMVEFRKLLLQKKSPLEGDVMNVLRETFKEFKPALKAVYHLDKMMGKEIEFDIRREEMEKEKVKDIENEKQPTVPASIPTLNDHNALLMSVDKARRITSHVSNSGGVATDAATPSCSGTTFSNLLSVSVSASPQLPPRRLSPNVEDNGSSPKLPANSKNRQRTEPKNGQTIDVTAGTSTSNVRGQSALKNMNPVVLLERLDEKQIQRYSTVVSSTPYEATGTARVIPKETDISNIRYSDASSTTSSASSVSQRANLKRKKSRK